MMILGQNNKAEMMPFMKAIFAVLLTFHKESTQLKSDLQSGVASESLQLAWATAGEITTTLRNDLKNKFQAGALDEIKTDFMAKAETFASLKVTGSDTLYQSVKS